MKVKKSNLVIVLLTALTISSCSSLSDIKLRSTVDWRTDIDTHQEPDQAILDVRMYKEALILSKHKMVYGAYHRSSIKNGWPSDSTDRSAENGLFIGYEYTINPTKQE
jgi:hypothetical protein